MSLLSAVPKAVVAAMQVALIALLVLTVIPVATGGLNIEVDDSDGTEYDEGTHTFTMRMSVNIDADLNFDITGFRADVRMASGGSTFIVYESEIVTIPKKSSGTYTFDMKIPLTTVMMMMLASLDDHDSVVIVNIHASTLGGMISVAASIGTPIVDDTEFPAEIYHKEFGDNKMEATFTVPGGGMIGTLFESLPANAMNVSGMIGNAAFELEVISSGEEYIVAVRMESTDDPLIESIDHARSGDGGVNVDYDDIGIVKLTKEQTDLMVNLLNMLHERWSP